MLACSRQYSLYVFLIITASIDLIFSIYLFNFLKHTGNAQVLARVFGFVWSPCRLSPSPALSVHLLLFLKASLTSWYCFSINGFKSKGYFFRSRESWYFLKVTLFLLIPLPPPCIPSPSPLPPSLLNQLFTKEWNASLQFQNKEPSGSALQARMCRSG